MRPRYGVSARDPGIFVATAAALFGSAVLACWLPARRAARLNPIDPSSQVTSDVRTV